MLGYGVGSTALCKLGKYPISEPKYVSSETLNQDSDMVHEIGQGGDPDLKGHSSGTYYGIGPEQSLCLRSVC